MPQGFAKLVFSTAPKRPVKPRPRLLLAYSGPKLVKSPAEIIAIIRARCADVLTEAEIALVIKLPALPAPAKPTAKPKRRRRS